MKKAIPIDKALLQACIDKAEINGPLSGISSLCDAVTPAYNAEKREGFADLSTATIRLRLLNPKIGLKFQTKPGKRGRAKGSTLSEAHKAAMQAGRTGKRRTLMSEQDYQAGRTKLLNDLDRAPQTPEDFRVNIRRILAAFDRWYKKPSAKRALHYHWIESCNGYLDCIKGDTDKTDPRWYYRPVRTKPEDTSE